MNPELWSRVKELYARAVEVPAAQREELVRALAGGNAELEREVLRLLGAGPTITGSLALVGSAFGTEVGQTIGGLKLLHELGEGGTGAVYLAEQRDGRRVAVKLLHRLSGAHDRAVARFQREADAVARLDHPGIVPLLAFGQDSGQWYYSMEYVAGPSLRSVIARAREGMFEGPVDVRDPRRCAVLVAGVLDALQHAHERGIIHRDVKPENILLEADGRPRLVDFGIARDLSLESVSSTTSGAITGTPHYMSPEQAAAVRRGVDYRTDQFSASVVLYELLTLRRPFDGTDWREVLDRILHDDPRPVRALNPRVAIALARVCHQGLCKAPRYRFADAAAFAAALRATASGARVTARRVPWTYRLARLVTRRRKLAAAVAVVTVACLVASTYAASRRETKVELMVRPSAPGQRFAAELIRFAEDPAAPPERVPLAGGAGAAVSAATAAGRMRVVVRGAAGALEAYREAEPGARIEVAPPLAAAPTEGMVLVTGGSWTLVLERIEGRLSVPVQVADFWIDACEVTNRAYLEFLRATGDQAALASPRWDAAAGERRRADWLDLPATGMTWAQARAFAERQGKRLPTLAEWELAAAGADRGAWLAGLDAGAVAAKLCVGLASEVIDLDAYLRGVRPAATPAGGLAHMVGNVWEWVEDPRYERRGATWRAVPQHRVAKGYAWMVPAKEIVASGLARETYLLDISSSVDVGFRCARSVNP